MNEISRKDLFFNALNAGSYKSLAWCLRCFSISEGDAAEPFTPYLSEGKWLVRLPDQEEPMLIADAPGTSPVYAMRDPVSYKAGEFTGADKDGDSNYTRILWHHIMVVYAFGAKIAFEPKGRTTSQLEKITSANLIGNPPEGEAVPDGKFTVSEHLAFTEAGACLLEGLAPIFAPATTERSLLTSPEVKKIRDKRLAENPDRWHDPAFISSVKSEMIAADKEYLKDDDSMGALAISSKAFNQVRIQTLGMHGEESAFTDGTRVTLIPTSLDEGLDLKFMPEYANGVRQASHLRGSETALGGELTQFLIRMFQNHAVDTTQEDCGTKGFLTVTIPQVWANWYYGLNVIDNGKLVELSADNIDQYVNRPIPMRSPQRCKSEGNTFCKACIGSANSMHPEALSGLLVDVGNIILYVFMKRAHGGALTTIPFDFFTDLH